MMFFKHLQTILFMLGVLTGTDGQNASTIERISFLLEILCPGEDVCFANRTEPRPPTSCCTGCSCKDDCHLSTNCCFPKQTENNAIPETQKSPNIDHSTCLYPFSTEPDVAQKVAINSYRMISSEDGASTQEACGNQIVAPWGALLPVYSKQKDMLFKNSACAEACNVKDGIMWNAYLICHQFTAKTYWLNDGATFAVNHGMNISDDCYVYFKYPEHELKSHVCYIPEDFIKTCALDPKFSMPPSFNLDMEEMVTACTSGLMAPFKYRRIFANIFCYICNHNYFFNNEVCYFDDEPLKTGTTSVGFFGLLDTDHILQNQKSTTKRNTRIACRSACIEVGSGACCREILCPSSQTRDYDGNCYFPTKDWYNSEYQVLVDLLAPHDINIEQLFTTGDYQDVLKPVWSKNWYIHAIFDVVNENRNIMVAMNVPYTRGSPDTLIRRVNRLIRSQWGFFEEDKLISLKSSISKLRSLYFATLHNFDETKVVISPNETKQFALPVFKQIYRRSTNSLGQGGAFPFVITELYYCKQVELLESEYIMVSNEYIYNKLTGNLMFTGEFTFINKNGILVPRVCLESSGLMESAGSRNVWYNIWFLVVIAWRFDMILL